MTSTHPRPPKKRIKPDRKITIAPIQTVYREYKFRSRLEARWAVALTEMGIPFDYEDEGYEVATGVWYLPDFIIRDVVPLFMEVKHKDDDDLAAMDKMGLLVAGTKQPGVIVYGDPVEHYAVMFTASDALPCGYVRQVADFANLVGWQPAAIKARQATF